MESWFLRHAPGLLWEVWQRCYRSPPCSPWQCLLLWRGVWTKVFQAMQFSGSCLHSSWPPLWLQTVTSAFPHQIWNYRCYLKTGFAPQFFLLKNPKLLNPNLFCLAWCYGLKVFVVSWTLVGIWSTDVNLFFSDSLERTLLFCYLYFKMLNQSSIFFLDIKMILLIQQKVFLVNIYVISRKQISTIK